MAISKLRLFLKKSKDYIGNYQNNLLNQNHVVIGNQACDADSMISTICYAYFKDCLFRRQQQQQQQLQQLQQQNNNENNSVLQEVHVQYLPIMAIPRSDINFRREVKILLNVIGINFEDLICLEECPMETFREGNSLTLTLMDHNYLSLNLHQRYSSFVSEIVDHHADQGYYLTVQGDNRVIAFNNQIGKAEVGSACTLVAEKLLENDLLDSELATLLLGVISVDTMNMSPSAGIGTERDLQAILALQPLSILPLDQLFPLLYNCKYDPQFWSDLSGSECLRFDYKLFDSPTCNIGISSIMLPISDPNFINKSTLENDCLNYIETNQLKILIILSFSPNPTPQREMMIISAASNECQMLVNFLMENDNKFLGLRQMMNDLISRKESQFSACGLSFQIFSQENVKASRKVISPEIIRYQKMREDR